MDRTGSIPIRMWDATQRVFDAFDVEDFVQIDGRVESYKDKPQIIVKKITKVDESSISMEDFLPATENDVAQMEKNLREILRKVEDKHLLELLAAFFNDEEFMARFRECPAAVQYHQAYLGGLLEHTLALAKLA